MFVDWGEGEFLILGGQEVLWSLTTKLGAVRWEFCSGTDASSRGGSVLACFGRIFLRSCVQAGILGMLVIDSGG